jgi:hypothetical protein
MTNYEHNDLSVFRRFIEDSLDLSDFFTEDTDEDSIRELDKGRNLIGFVPDSFEPENLEQAIKRIWTSLQAEKPGPRYWQHHLSSLERDTRVILQELLLTNLYCHFNGPLTEQQFRSVIAYSMTAGWLVMGGLLAEYAPDDIDMDEPDNDIQSLF